MDLVIDSKWIYYPASGNVIEDARIIIEGSKIIYSGPQTSRKFNQTDYEYYNFKKGMIFPGMINAHTHIPMSLLRGIADGKLLQPWLEHIWSIEPNLLPKDVYWGTLLGIAEMFASGTVGFNDQYFFSDQIAEAVHQTGIKAALAPSIFFDGNPEAESMEEAFIHAKNVHDKWNGVNDRIWIKFGPHAPYTVDKEWFQEIAVEARNRNTTIHTHFNETQYEINESKKAHGLRPIEWIESIGVLDVIDSAAHCIHVSKSEVELLKKYNVNVLHCPKSNAKIGAGIANIPNYIKNGVNVCLGTDGPASNNKHDMIEEMAFEAIIHKAHQMDPTIIDTSDILKMSTINASPLFPNNSYKGTLEVNSPADLIVIDFDSPATIPVIQPESHLCYAVGREQVTMTVVDGSIVYHDGRFLPLDIEKIKKETQKITDRLLSS